jgi:hypothetical protein
MAFLKRDTRANRAKQCLALATSAVTFAMGQCVSDSGQLRCMRHALAYNRWAYSLWCRIRNGQIA